MPTTTSDDDVPVPSADNEEIVDPSVPEGNTTAVVIRRHIFGLIVLYIQVILGVGLSLGLLFFLASTLEFSADHQAQLAMVAVIIGLLASIFLIIATALYRDNRLTVTDDDINQHLRIGLFKIHTSSLSMSNIEDVTSNRDGIFAQIFGFGMLRIETAGEVPYFHFAYCPRPDTYAKVILDARERFINSNPEAAKRANPLTDPPGLRGSAKPVNNS